MANDYYDDYGNAYGAGDPYAGYYQPEPSADGGGAAPGFGGVPGPRPNDPVSSLAGFNPLDITYDMGGGTAAAPGGGSVRGYGGPWAPDYGFLGDAPGFSFEYEGGRPFDFPEFQAPESEDVLKDPGYQFRLDQGRRALESSAAGRGTLRTGGTLKDILQFGQQLGSQEYGNVFDRSLGAWSANRNNALQNFTTNYNNAYQKARDAYQPQFDAWKMRQELQARAADQAFQRQWQAYAFDNPSASEILNLAYS